MYHILVEKLKLFGYHGVRPEEKREGQPFIYDLSIDMEDKDFEGNDDIRNTINYSEVVNLVKEVNSSRKFDLLETLAQAVAKKIFKKFDTAGKVAVRIRKTQPPIKEELDSVGVEFIALRSRFDYASCFLSMGSNTGNSLDCLSKAVQIIRTHPDIALSKISSVYKTEPMYEKNQDDFLNLVLEIAAGREINPFEFLGFLKSIEYRLGRNTYKKLNGPRPIDIDIVYWEGIEIQSPFLTIPHPRYTKRNFVLLPLSEIRPDFLIEGQKIKSYIKEKKYKEKVRKLGPKIYI